MNETITRQPGQLPALGHARTLLGWYLGLSLLTLAAAAALHDDTGAVNTAVWIRGTIVAASALIMVLLAARVARGSKGAYRRLRIVSAVVLVAIVVIVAVPGPFPLWLKIEQSVCGFLLLGVVGALNGRQLRSAFHR